MTGTGRIRVLFFGATADAVGSREISLAIDKTTTAGSLIHQLSTSFPKLAGQKLLFAINEEYRDADALLRNEDEVAIFTAVSGG